MRNAAQSQYGTPPGSCVACLHASASHPLPHTGFALGGPFVLGVALVVVGVLVRGAVHG